ncbi:hypothetical protein NEMBOFW57_006165 [Staphylotrichum longicolle]|uniref:SP-RING-type domain-containing protein n=1 Tax=Staphylotrichum longicolle TaxID=669026 RepID=A0AAD4HWK6_9PEZI|nr:hypothetical protein NEMBOFW57_006165 [Staphylotrichum longicolle]
MPPPQPSAAGSPRPPAAVERQIASSNATANAFLGGRQPSWMTPGTAAPRRPNPRPAAPRPPVPPAAQQPQQHHQHYQPPQQQQQTQPPPVLPSPAPSDEPSPALSNVLDSPKRNPTPLPDVHNMGPANAPTPALLPVTDARFILDPPTIPRAQEAPRPGPVGATPHIESFGFVFEGIQGDRQDNRHGRNPSFDGNSTPTASRGPLPPLKPPAKRRRVEQTTASLLPILEQYVQACGGNHALDSAVEKPRVMLLTEACKSEDAFFLVLHQLFSMWSLDASDAYANIPLHRSVIDNAFKILESVLKKNELLSLAHQQWFSRFPVANGRFSYAPIGDAALISQIATFLAALINEHHSLLGAAMQRNYPFLVDELLARLSCYSPVLQFILFTACRRQLGVPDGDLGAQLEQAFRDDQARHRDPSQQQPILQGQQQPVVQSQQQPLVQGQQRQQLPSQLLNQQQYQRNLQIAQQQLPSHSSAQTATQSPTYATHRAVHPVQTIQTQQMQYNPWVQQFQPVTSPITFINNGMHAGPTPTPQYAAQQIQRDLQRSRSSRAKDPLVPPKGTQITRPEWPYDPADRKAILMSLHQAHVRSPKRVIKNGAAERFYQAVKALPVEPTPIAPKKTLFQFRFEVTEEQSAMAARKSKLPGALLPVVEHFNGALRWRVRCCIPPSSSEPLTQQQWVTLDGNWPSFMHMTLNDRVLEIRRRPHNGKDLPTEVTDFIVPGTNILKIALHEAPGEPSQSRLLAVEMLETLSHSAIVKSIWSQGPIPEQETLNTIKKRLTSSADDEIAFEAPDLSIDLADPFSSTIFKIPARGVACTHMECFDLENWLNTRPAKPPISCPHKRVKCTCPNTAEPSNPDKWRCPICSKDARPYSLRIDGFLLKVRAQLEAEGKLHTKSLRVKADGSWSVVLEDDDDGASDDDGAGPAVPVSVGARKAPQVPALPRREVEVIELD